MTLSFQSKPAGDQAMLREMNLSATMWQIHAHAPISRSELASSLNLNKATVTSLVRDLISHGFVQETGSLPANGVGRPAVMLAFAPDAGHIISGEIGVDFIKVIRANLNAEVSWRNEQEISPNMGQQEIIDQVITMLQTAVAEQTAVSFPLLGISLVVPGLVDPDTGNLLFAPNLGWRGIPLSTILRDAFAVPVFVNNEAKMAALGEHLYGVAKAYHEILYISAGVGLGGAIVRNGHLFSGISGVGGEFGHMTIRPDGLLCNCGNTGCWETLVSQTALFRPIQQAVDLGQQTILSSLIREDASQLTVTAVVEAARREDAVALAALNEVGSHLGLGLASLINALNPELIVLGGILSMAADFLLSATWQEIDKRSLTWGRQSVEIKVAEYGADAGVIGGVAAVYQELLSNPMQFM